MKFKGSFNGNVIITLENGNERNTNVLKIHSNNIGKTLYTNENVYDSDFLKIVRFLEQNKYSSLYYTEIVQKLCKKCRHLDIKQWEISEI